MVLEGSFSHTYELISPADALDRIRRASSTQNGTPANAGSRVADILDGRAGGALRERLYVDRDYSAAYAAYYGRQFVPPPHFTERYHFFDEPVETLDEASLTRGQYLGFVVIWPTVPRVIGRTSIEPPPYENDAAWSTTFVSMRTEASIAGISFQIDTPPYATKDYGVSACATIATWLASELVAERARSQRATSAAVTLAANERDLHFGRALPQMYGLSVDQIVRVLDDLGVEPVIYGPGLDGPVSWRPARTIGPYIDSGLPSILIIEVLEAIPREGEEPERRKFRHALLAIGYRVHRDQVARGHSITARIQRFIVHDDRHGPFVEIDILTDPTTGAIRIHHPYFPNAELISLETIIAPHPVGVGALPYDAITLHKEWLHEQSPQETGADVRRTRLILGTELKAEALSWGDENLSRSIREISLPRWVWVTEMFDPDNLEVHGRVISDPTLGRQAVRECLIWAHAGSSLFNYMDTRTSHDAAHP